MLESINNTQKQLTMLESISREHTFEINFNKSKNRIKHSPRWFQLLPPSQIVWSFGHFTHIKKCN